MMKLQCKYCHQEVQAPNIVVIHKLLEWSWPIISHLACHQMAQAGMARKDHLMIDLQSSEYHEIKEETEANTASTEATN